MISSQLRQNLVMISTEMLLEGSCLRGADGVTVTPGGMEVVV